MRFVLSGVLLTSAGCGNDGVLHVANTDPTVTIEDPGIEIQVEGEPVFLRANIHDEEQDWDTLSIDLSFGVTPGSVSAPVAQEDEVAGTIVQWEVAGLPAAEIAVEIVVTDDKGASVEASDTIRIAADEDGDGYGTTEGRDWGDYDDDCDDLDPSVHPDATEVCNGVDDDCNGTADDGLDAYAWYFDNDGDGYGNAGAAYGVETCVPPDGYVDNADDCNDSDADVNPDTVWFADSDGDGFGATDATKTSCEQPDGHAATSDDCNDANADVHPDAEEVCNDLDDDCDDLVDDDDDSVTPDTTWYVDADSDGFGDSASSLSACDQPDGYDDDATDCDDTDPAVNPDATEVCNDLDDDCDDLVDDDDDSVDLSTGTVFYQDTDGDGYGDEDLDQRFCAEASGWSSLDTDCDDGNASINPAGSEVCNDEDDDCDGLTDTDDDSLDLSTASTVYVDADADGYGDTDDAGTSACSIEAGFAATADDCDDANADVNPAATEVCNDGVDDDCDGLVDADDDTLDASSTTTWYTDSDGDGFGDIDAPQAACDQPSDAVDDDQDCDDSDAGVHPGADETCNDGLDDDCDGLADDDDTVVDGTQTWYADADSDGYGDSGAPTEACLQPSGYEDDAEDCDDTNGEVNPAATEVCDDVDNDCDGEEDEDDASGASTWYEDADGDGYGTDATPATACDQPSGFEAVPGDCDDGDGDIHPDATEVCNAIEDDCDELVDDDDGDLDSSTGTEWFADTDADGHGDPDASVQLCTQPSGYAADADDCDDGDAAVSPGGEELCDGIDNDCDGDTDEDDATDVTTWYADADGDGYGDPDVTTATCDQPSGYEDDAEDCDDADADANPAEDEICDEIDNDCDGLVDDADTNLDTSTATIWYLDSDDDGFGYSVAYDVACDQPSGYVTDASDCDDDSDEVHPDAEETCNDIDDDCDGSVDDEDGSISCNTAPTISGVTLTPDPAYADSELLCEAEGATDAEGDTIYLAYEWSIDGIFESDESDTLSGFDKGDVVQCAVTPSDSDDEGDTESASVTISNSPPTAPVVSIAPALPYPAEDDLVCEITSEAVDIDDDAIDYTFAWTVDESSATATTTTYTDDTVEAAETDFDEEWVCTVIADDGDESSDTATATAVLPTLYDDFEDGSADASLWTVTTCANSEHGGSTTLDDASVEDGGCVVEELDGWLGIDSCSYTSSDSATLQFGTSTALDLTEVDALYFSIYTVVNGSTSGGYPTLTEYRVVDQSGNSAALVAYDSVSVSDDSSYQIETADGTWSVYRDQTWIEDVDVSDLDPDDVWGLEFFISIQQVGGSTSYFALELYEIATS